MSAIPGSDPCEQREGVVTTEELRLSGVAGRTKSPWALPGIDDCMRGRHRPAGSWTWAPSSGWVADLGVLEEMLNRLDLCLAAHRVSSSAGSAFKR
jgi:hypothetical protein